MRRHPLVVMAAIAVFGWTVAGATATAGADTTPAEFPPNVRPLAPNQLSISTSNRHEKLNFAFSPENIGTGPLEVKPVQEDCNNDGNANNDRTASQNVYGDTNGNGVYDPPDTSDPLGPDGIVRTRTVGCFTFDARAGHMHWHFENYAKYRLLSLKGKVLAKRTKVGFCLTDDTSVETLPGTPDTRIYVSCDDLVTQGISVGWADVYHAFIAGQSIVIDRVAEGRYCLVQRADPKGQLQESDTTDNQTRLRIRIQGTRVQALSNPC
jgi:hypothetical protein